MGFMVVVILFTGLLSTYLKRRKDRYYIVKAIGFALFASFIANISLYHNYTQSLVPGLYDGIAISNIIAYQFFPDHSWSTEFFKRRYDQSIIISVILLISLIIMYLMERGREKRI